HRALGRLLGGAAHRAGPDGGPGVCHRAAPVPPSLRPRPAIQPAPDLWPGLHLRGVDAADLGGAGPAANGPSGAGAAAQSHRLLPLGQRGRDLRDHGAGSAPAAARDTGRGGPPVSASRRRRLLPTHIVVIWFLLLSLPVWLLAVGGYYSLVTQVLILGLAAM